MASSAGFTGGQFRGRGRGSRSHWRGRVAGPDNPSGRRINETSGEINPAQKRPPNVRPTHFLALPLHNHPALRSRVAAFQAALFGDDVQSNTGAPRFSRNAIRTSSHVEGLDSSIVVDPVRMHMTLGVMALESEDDNAVENDDGGGTSSRQCKTVSTALSLLASLSSQISQILDGEKGVKVPLEVLNVFREEKMRPRGPRKTEQSENVGAGVLFLGPRESSRDTTNDERRKLMDVCELINRTFRDAGYLTDLRPLKLHCTILNASYRKPRGWFPFSYTDIRSNRRACNLICSSQPAASQEPQIQNTTPASAQTRALLPPISVNLGAWQVDEVQLWVMGSRDEEGRYVSCGGIKLGGSDARHLAHKRRVYRFTENVKF